jgi:hypothetical protein
MSFWILLWKACLIGAIAVFAVTAVVVTIGGAVDVRRLLRKLRDL